MPMPIPGDGGPPGGGAPGGGTPGGGTGPAMAPGPQMGSEAQAMTGIKLGLEAFQKALPGIPMGSELHTAIMGAITKISKHMASGAGDANAQVQQLVAMARQAHAQPEKAAQMAGMMPGGGGAGASPPPAQDAGA